ncbi:MAG: hypothetical protein IPH26_15040 [Sterolibacteriaceae bacterium]|uniref:Uncharacterized protein n=1 Tax=Candidatus Methylophosphatis roskildensis TaxID=2899263 RepID=A0A9D7E529_9PROT|nr:hypothetical protein [Candidatus Methylophosphatis roskildensis]
MVADLDPQINASVTLISEERWAETDRAGQTVARPLSDRLNPNHQPKFDIEESIGRGVSTGNRSLRAWRPTWSRTSPAVGSRWGWRWNSSCATHCATTGLRSVRPLRTWPGDAVRCPSLQAFWSAIRRPETRVVTSGRQQGDLRINREQRDSGGREDEIGVETVTPEFSPPAKPRACRAFVGREKGQSVSGLLELVADG